MDFSNSFWSKEMMGRCYCTHRACFVGCVFFFYWEQSSLLCKKNSKKTPTKPKITTHKKNKPCLTIFKVQTFQHNERQQLTEHKAQLSRRRGNVFKHNIRDKASVPTRHLASEGTLEFWHHKSHYGNCTPQPPTT